MIFFLYFGKVTYITGITVRIQLYILWYEALKVVIRKIAIFCTTQVIQKYINTMDMMVIDEPFLNLCIWCI